MLPAEISFVGKVMFMVYVTPEVSVYGSVQIVPLGKESVKVELPNERSPKSRRRRGRDK